MIFRRPCYYDSFRCTADKCNDNCCIGWEICIDSETAAFYKTVDGNLGRRLKESITADDEPSFILKNERCPFLNENNLCDIITELGENALCQICRDHPRWFEWYGNEKEGGIGLSCEEGARLILTEEGFADYFESECDDLPDEDFDKEAYTLLFNLRDKIFNILSEEDLPLTERYSNILDLTLSLEAMLNGEKKQTLSPVSFEKELEKSLLLLPETEPIDEKWTCTLERLIKNPPSELYPDKNEEKYLTRLFAYFVWRYFLTSVFDIKPAEKIKFAFFSVTVIFALYKSSKENNLCSLLKSAVLYSKQMEYSEENLQFFFEQY